METENTHVMVKQENTFKYKCSDFAKMVGVEQATVAYHCKVANKKYYQGVYTKPPHPDFVEVSGFGKWIGSATKTYILPMSEHNKNFYSEDMQKERLSSRKLGKKSAFRKQRIETKPRKTYVKRNANKTT